MFLHQGLGYASLRGRPYSFRDRTSLIAVFSIAKWGNTHRAGPGSPVEVRRSADPVLACELVRPDARFPVLQDRDDLRICELRLPHDNPLAAESTIHLCPRRGSLRLVEDTNDGRKCHAVSCRDHHTAPLCRSARCAAHAFAKSSGPRVKCPQRCAMGSRADAQPYVRTRARSLSSSFGENGHCVTWLICPYMALDAIVVVWHSAPYEGPPCVPRQAGVG